MATITNSKNKRTPRKVTNSKDIQELISLKENDITYSYLMNIFGKFNSKIRFYPYDEIIIPPNSYGPEGNKLDKTIYTTVGLWIYNKYFIENDLYDVFQYINKTITSKEADNMNARLTRLMLEDKIELSTFKRYLMKTQKIMPLVNIISPSITDVMLFCTKVIEKKKKELIAQNKQKIDEGDIQTIIKIQTETLEFAREYLKDDPSMDIWNSGARGSFENNFKNMFVMKGPIANFDPTASKDYNFVLSNYMTGIDKGEYSTLANGLVAGPYYRAGKTQIGGYWEKLFRNAFQHVTILPEGSDCHTTGTVEVDFSSDNIDDFIYMYIVENNGELVEITSDNIDKYNGKKVRMRFPTECIAKNGSKCSKCAGNLYHRIGITNIGVASPQVASRLKNLCMKNFHDSEVKLVELNPEEVFDLTS